MPIAPIGAIGSNADTETGTGISRISHLQFLGHAFHVTHQFKNGREIEQSHKLADLASDAINHGAVKDSLN